MKNVFFGPYALFLIFQILSYFVVGGLSVRFSWNGWSPYWPWGDSLVPFFPPAVWIYILYYPLMASPLFLKLSREKTRHLLCGLVSASLLNYLLAFFVSVLPAPHASLREGSPGWTLVVLEWIYQNDIKGLYFPSLHVLHSLLIGFCFWGTGPGGVRKALLPASLGVAVSAVLVKQHFVADILASLLLAPVLYWVLYPVRSKPLGWLKKKGGGIK